MVQYGNEGAGEYENTAHLSDQAKAQRLEYEEAYLRRQSAFCNQLYLGRYLLLLQ